MRPARRARKASAPAAGSRWRGARRGSTRVRGAEKKRRGGGVEPRGPPVDASPPGGKSPPGGWFFGVKPPKCALGQGGHTLFGGPPCPPRRRHRRTRRCNVRRCPGILLISS